MEERDRCLKLIHVAPFSEQLALFESEPDPAPAA